MGIAKKDFVHLHVHTQYSLLDGANRLDLLFKKVSEYGMDSLAMTDHGRLFGAIDFIEEASKAGIKPIIGIEAYVAPGNRMDRKETGDSHEGINHMILLAMNDEGYRNLLQLSTISFLEGFYKKPRVDREVLAKYNGGLIATSACLNGVLSRSLLDGDTKKAMALAGEYAEIFKDRFYLEVQSNGLSDQVKLNNGLLDLKKRLGLPLVATNDCHYLLKEHAASHDILLCIQTGKSRMDADRLKFGTEELYLKSPQEMAALFADVPEAVLNTREIAERCNLRLEFGKTYHIPRFPLPSGETVDSYLEKLTVSGLEERMPAILARSGGSPEETREKYEKRMREELTIIRSMGFSGYFLIVADAITHAKSQHIPVGPGRGSAAGSLTAYALKITDVDPIPYSLLFERFLNPHRKSLPDIDMDFCEMRRDEVFAYIVGKYGVDHVAHITTFGKLQPRVLIRDVGRAMGIPFGDVDKIAKMVPENAKDIDEALKMEPRLKKVMDETPQVEEMIRISRSLQGLCRHSSTHAAGVVISDTPLNTHLPLYKDDKGQIVTQYDMKSVEKIGLVKFDFLGLKTLTLIDRAVALIKKRTGTEIPLQDIPLDDPAVFALLSAGDTRGVFQLESSGMVDVVKSLKPERFEDIVALLALYRPGPMKMIDDFIRRKQGKVTVEYLHPDLEPILRDTYGVMLYQEQVMQIVHVLAGFTLAEADNLRAAIGKKKKDVIRSLKPKFISGAMDRGVAKKTAEEIFSQMESFGEYGFNKSHSVAYSVVAFQTAYIKAHYPVEFMAATLSSIIGDLDQVKKYIDECRRMNIPVLPPDINESDMDFSVAGTGAIRFGLGAVKNVGEGAVDAILKARGDGGPFSDIFDFFSRVEAKGINKRVVESLAMCGAFDSTGATRAQVMAVLDAALAAGQARRKDIAAGQMTIFGGAGAAPSPPEYPAVTEYSEQEILKMEKDTIGIYLTSHPLKQYEGELKRYAPQTSASLMDLSDGARAVVGGLRVVLKQNKTKKGDLMGFLTLEDLTGAVEIVVFPEVYKRSIHILQGEDPIIVKGKTDRNEMSVKIIADDIITLAEARKRHAPVVHLRMEAGGSADILDRLKGALESHTGPCRTVLHLQQADGSEVVISLPSAYSVAPSEAMMTAVRDILGPGGVEI